ncbi:Azurin [Candidatus Zixiibacteriota bacterium]|nr:Azurin [candidate division Zixibacteria bacterium]
MKSSLLIPSNLALTVLLLLAIVFQGCSNKAENRTHTNQVQQSSSRDTVRLEITGNDQMRYNEKELRVKAGDVVVLTMKHVGQMPKTVMGHNWVLLKHGVDMASFAQDAMQAKATDYIPAARSGDIIAHTKLLGGGESDTITFDAPAQGTYTFLCSFPGHYGTMNGLFIVE